MLDTWGIGIYHYPRMTVNGVKGRHMGIQVLSRVKVKDFGAHRTFGDPRLFKRDSYGL